MGWCSKFTRAGHVAPLPWIAVPSLSSIDCCLWKPVRAQCNQRRAADAEAAEAAQWKPDIFSKYMQGRRTPGLALEAAMDRGHILSLQSPDETKGSLSHMFRQHWFTASEPILSLDGKTVSSLHAPVSRLSSLHPEPSPPPAPPPDS